MCKYFSLIFVLYCFLALSQKNEASISELEVQYEYAFVRDTTDIDSSHRLKEIMILDLNRNSSVFYSQQYMAVRKIFNQAAIDSQFGHVNINTGDLPKYKISYTAYRSGDQTFVTAGIGRDFYTFESNNLKWNTDYNDIKIILGYQCNKATTYFNNRIYTAWYTKEIPIADGPYRFKGLTGLIMEASDKNNYHTFKAIGIEKKLVEIKRFQKGIPITREQYLKKREEFKNNPYPERKNLSKETRDKMIEAFKKDNNSIEN